MYLTVKSIGGQISILSIYPPILDGCVAWLARPKNPKSENMLKFPIWAFLSITKPASNLINFKENDKIKIEYVFNAFYLR